MWNEIFTFDVSSGKELLEVTAFDRDDFGSDDFLGRFDLTLERFKDQQPHDEWYDLLPDKPNTNWHGRLRLVVQYVYSKTRVLTGYINLWTEQIENEEMELRELRAALIHIESPFGFIKGFQMEQTAVNLAQIREDEMEERKEETLAAELKLPPALAEKLQAMEEKEQVVEKKLDEVAGQLAMRAGYE